MAKVDCHALRQGMLIEDEVNHGPPAGDDLRRNAPLGSIDSSRQTVLRILAKARGK